VLCVLLLCLIFWLTSEQIKGSSNSILSLDFVSSSWMDFDESRLLFASCTLDTIHVCLSTYFSSYECVVYMCVRRILFWMRCARLNVRNLLHCWMNSACGTIVYNLVELWAESGKWSIIRCPCKVNRIIQIIVVYVKVRTLNEKGRTRHSMEFLNGCGLSGVFLFITSWLSGPVLLN
jgi:hypothetical protein